jgi:hypothetical protein
MGGLGLFGLAGSSMMVVVKPWGDGCVGAFDGSRPGGLGACDPSGVVHVVEAGPCGICCSGVAGGGVAMALTVVVGTR